MFVKAGAILPKTPERNWIEEGKQEDLLIVDVYPSRASSFTIYEDDGKSISYQKGTYSKIKIS